MKNNLHELLYKVESLIEENKKELEEINAGLLYATSLDSLLFID